MPGLCSARSWNSYAPSDVSLISPTFTHSITGASHGCRSVVFSFAEYALDPKRRELRRIGGDLVRVQTQVFDVLEYLICNRDRVVSKDDLINEFWDVETVSNATVDNCISAARAAIGDNGKDQRLIKTIQRKGTRFIGDVQEYVQEDQSPAPLEQAPEVNVPTASSEAGQPRATASAADAKGQDLNLVSERAPVLSDTILRYLAIVDALALIGCVFARAPSELSMNAGYILVFGPMLILLASAWVAVRGHRATGYWQRPDVHLARIFFSLPALTSAFLSLEFFLLLAPPGECPTFLRWKYLTDLSIEAFKPEYCMGLDAQIQVHGPWLMSPVILQAWFQVVAPIAIAALCFRAFRAWQPALEIQRGEDTERGEIGATRMAGHLRNSLAH
jgi:DNA-binding winged helix-turn-helix (wHTH) protein